MTIYQGLKYFFLSCIGIINLQTHKIEK
jgi:hypothetical protein